MKNQMSAYFMTSRGKIKNLWIVMVLLVNILTPCFGSELGSTKPSGNAVTVTADFSKNEYYPLVKERIGLFDEVELMRDEQQFVANQSKLDEIPPAYFRVLGGFGENKRFNTPSQVYENDGKISVRVSQELDEAFRKMREYHVTPIMSFLGSPLPFQGPGGVHGKPTDMAKYAIAMSQLADLYAKGGPFIWEIWNEPDLGGFLKSTDFQTDYFEIFKNTASAINSVNPDIMIAGPAFRSGADTKEFHDFVTNYFAEKRTNPSLGLDYFSFHFYGPVTNLNRKFRLARAGVQDKFNTVPFLVTEYENWTPGDSYSTKNLRELAKGAVVFLDHLKLLLENTDVAAVTWNRSNRNTPDTNSNPGGFLSYYGVKHAVYNAFKIYGWMPVDRNSAVITPGANNTIDGVDALASSDEHNGGVLAWNASTAIKTVTIGMKNIPALVASNGRLRVYRIDARHASAGDAATPDDPTKQEMVVESSQAINSSSESITLDIPASGIVYVRLDDQSGLSLRGQDANMKSAKYVRTWSWCPRVLNPLDSSQYISEGNYGVFDPVSWTLRVGTKTAQDEGIAGVTMDNTPSVLGINFHSKDVHLSGGKDDLAALRLDYWNNGAYEKSVLFHGAAFDAARTQKLPWGKAGTTGDVVIDKGSLIGNGQDFSIDVDAYAPSGWVGSRRRCIVSAWTKGTGIGSQSVITLSNASPLAKKTNSR